jgi:hypothetical protein
MVKIIECFGTKNIPINKEIERAKGLSGGRASVSVWCFQSGPMLAAERIRPINFKNLSLKGF